MVTLKNNGGAVRVVFDASGRQVAVPPNSEISGVLLVPSAIKRFQRNMRFGDTLEIIIDDPIQPLGEEEMPPQPLKNGNGLHAGGEEKPAPIPAPEPPPASPPEPAPPQEDGDKKGRRQNQRPRRQTFEG